MTSTYSYKPLTSGNWKDFESLFGEKGACAGCWCMYWKLKRSEWNIHKGGGNRKKQKKMVDTGIIPGIILYAGKEPLAWCAVEPRDRYPVMDNSRVLKRPDEEKVWSIGCFFVRKDQRKKGLSIQLLEFAKDYCKGKKVKILEGYPTEVKKETAGPFVWTGLRSAFIKAGFTEIIRRSPTRPIMRFYL